MPKTAKDSTTALDVANYLIENARKERRFVDPMTLQKLLYYAQCWHLAEYGSPLFPEPIEAWTWGPVVRVVWKAYSGKRPIIPDDVYFDDLNDSQKEVVNAVWTAYGHISGPRLSAMTHREQPWTTARKGKGERDRSDKPLRLDLMRKAAESTLAGKNEWVSKHMNEIMELVGESD
jgi:uncharacterized phage-associated protein